MIIISPMISQWDESPSIEGEHERRHHGSSKGGTTQNEWCPPNDEKLIFG